MVEHIPEFFYIDTFFSSLCCRNFKKLKLVLIFLMPTYELRVASDRLSSGFLVYLHPKRGKITKNTHFSHALQMTATGQNKNSSFEPLEQSNV